MDRLHKGDMANATDPWYEYDRVGYRSNGRRRAVRDQIPVTVYGAPHGLALAHTVLPDKLNFFGGWVAGMRIHPATDKATERVTASDSA